MRELLLGFGLCILMISAAHAEDGTRMLHDPDISADRIVFVYAGDLWTAPATGGEGRRLTAHVGTESSPKFSPDGRWIAFSAQYDGNTDVYIIPSEGGNPKRLTAVIPNSRKPSRRCWNAFRTKDTPRRCAPSTPTGAAAG